MKTLIMPGHRITRQDQGGGKTDVRGTVLLRCVGSDKPLKEATLHFSFPLSDHADMTDRQILEMVEESLKAATLPGGNTSAEG